MGEQIALLERAPGSLRLQPDAATAEVAELEALWHLPSAPEIRIGQEADSVHRLGSVALEAAGVVTAAQLSNEAACAARKRNELLMGGVASKAAVSQENSEQTLKSSLPERIRRARVGDQEALQSIKADAITEVVEQICKSGAIMETTAYMSRAGELTQFGSTTEERQRNTLHTFSPKSSGLSAMTHAEGQNGFTIEELYRRGLLKNNAVVEFSLIPDEDRAALADSGLFLREVVGIIRITQIQEDGTCKIQSILVSGTDQEALPAFTEGMTAQDEAAIESQALANRFDIKTVRRMYELLGVAGASTMSPAELLSTPIILPQGFDGFDVAMLYDQVASDIAGKQVMLGLPGLYQEVANGRALTRTDYEAQAKKTKELQSELHAIGAEVAQELIKQGDGLGGDSYRAGRLLHKIAKHRAVQYVGDSGKIDTRVFGAETHFALQNRQQLIAVGDIAGARKALEYAQEKAKGTGCPTGRQKSGEDDSERDPLDVFGGYQENDSGEASSGKKKMNCPFCRAKVYDDPCARVLKCGDCKAKVVDGVVVYEGDGGSKARAARRAELTKQIDEAFAGAGVESFGSEQNKIQNTQGATGKLAVASSAG